MTAVATKKRPLSGLTIILSSHHRWTRMRPSVHSDHSPVREARRDESHFTSGQIRNDDTAIRIEAYMIRLHRDGPALCIHIQRNDRDQDSGILRLDAAE